MKKELRKKYREIRRGVENKNEIDKKIGGQLFKLLLNMSVSRVLYYASLDEEVNIDFAITASLEKNMSVALPLCIDNDGEMQYYYIKSLNELKIGAFGIREPDTAVCEAADNLDGAVCVVPGLAFDKKGFRLGYGKGYYDRFLSRHKNIKTIGVCYDETLAEGLPYDKYDIPVDYIVTQSGVFKAEKGGQNG